MVVHEQFNFLNCKIYITAFFTHSKPLNVYWPIVGYLKPGSAKEKYSVENRTGLLVLYLCPNNKAYIIFEHSTTYTPSPFI